MKLLYVCRIKLYDNKMFTRITRRSESVRYVISSFINANSTLNKTCNVKAFEQTRYSNSESKDRNNEIDELPKSFWKYRVFQEEEAQVILDVQEERLKLEETTQEAEENEFSGLRLERGVDGVFDIEELVELLRRERVSDLFVATVPKELNYVNYIVVVSGKSQRHMLAVAEIVRKLYKRKRNRNDTIPRIEGECSKEWIAVDLGNMALHIFSPKARRKYDLESLWSVGSEFDLGCNKPEDPVLELLEKHSVYLGDLQPAEHVSGAKYK